MVVMIVVMAFMVVGMVMRLESAALADRQKLYAVSFAEFDDFGIAGKGFEGIGQEHLETGAGPENNVRTLKRCRIRGPESVVMRRGCTLDEEDRRAGVAHDCGDERMNGFCGGDDIGRGYRGAGHKQRGSGGEGEGGFVHRLASGGKVSVICYVITLAEVLCYNVLKCVKRGCAEKRSAHFPVPRLHPALQG